VGVSRVERERERAVDLWSERRSIGREEKWRGLEMAISEKGHLSISIIKSIE